MGKVQIAEVEAIVKCMKKFCDVMTRGEANNYASIIL